MKTIFNDILEKNETIIKVYKPQKTRFWFGTISSAIIYPLLFLIWIIPTTLAFMREVEAISIPGIVVTIIISVLLLSILSACIIGSIAYKNRYYAYSNKRILIRSGIIGVDYRTLDFQSMTATSVRVGFVDKILGTKTGTIMFGSPSSPVVTMQGNSGARTANPYNFPNIERPYDTLREIKEYIDTASNNLPTK